MQTPHYLSNEQTLDSYYPEVIQPFWQTYMQHGAFDGVGEISIAYAYVVHPQSKGSIVICSGRIESMLKYKEVVYDLYQNGYSVFIHDHRGQGLSGRMTSNSHMGYVECFDDYITDFKTFVDDVVMANSQSKPKLLAHSMGGAIATLTILKYPSLFAKAVLSAPMFGIRPSLPSWLENFLLWLHQRVSKGVAYFFGQKDYVAEPFKHNVLTQSEVRYQIFRQEYAQTPQVQLGGVTGHWLKVALVAMDYIEKNIELCQTPMLVFQAGGDQVVDNKRQTRVVKKMRGAELIVIENAKHELLEEQDKYRGLCLNRTFDFLAG